MLKEPRPRWGRRGDSGEAEASPGAAGSWSRCRSRELSEVAAEPRARPASPNPGVSFPGGRRSRWRAGRSGQRGVGGGRRVPGLVLRPRELRGACAYLALISAVGARERRAGTGRDTATSAREATGSSAAP